MLPSYWDMQCTPKAHGVAIPLDIMWVFARVPGSATILIGLWAILGPVSSRNRPYVW